MNLESAVERTDSSEPIKTRVLELDTRFTHRVTVMFLQPPMTIGGCFRGIPRNSSHLPDPRNPPIVIGGWSTRSATALSKMNDYETVFNAGLRLLPELPHTSVRSTS